MALKLRLKTNSAITYALGAAYDGGYLDAMLISAGVYCPIVVYDDAVDTIGDDVLIQSPRALSDLFTVYDDAASTPNPLFHPDYTAIPVVSGTPSKDYTNAAQGDYDTTFSIAISNNPLNYKIQFCTNKWGGAGGTSGVDVNGFPVSWEAIARDGFGKYNVETISHNVNTQTIQMRFERPAGVAYNDTFKFMQNYTPMPLFDINNSGGTPTTTVPAVAAHNGVPLLAHVWGMFGNDDPVNFKQGTYEDDLAAIEEAAVNRTDILKCLPFYAKYNASGVPYNVTAFSSDGLGAFTTAKRQATLYYSFLLTSTVMTNYLEYAVQAGLQGFMVLNYAKDTYLSLFQRLFRVHPDKRGLKMCLSLDVGGSGRDTYDDSNSSTNGGVTVYRDEIWQFALDIKQTWYATARKMIAGVSTQVPIIYLLIENAGTIQATIDKGWQDLARIKARRVALGLSAVGETYNVLMTTGPDIDSRIALPDDTGNQWNAKSSYYLYTAISNGFPTVGTLLDQSMAPGSTGTGGMASNRQAPMISWGMDNNPRYQFQYKTSVSYFQFSPEATAGTVLNYMPTLIGKLKGHMGDNTKDLRLALCGQVGEFAEQGRDLFPNIDKERRLLDMFKAAFNAYYVLPV